MIFALLVKSYSMAQGTLGRAATGGVFRDHMGVVIGAYCFNVGIGMAFLAEISTLIQGIEYVHQRGWHRLWIELDSMAVLQCLLSPSYMPPWRVTTRWDNCKQLLKSMRFYCSHIYREIRVLFPPFLLYAPGSGLFRPFFPIDFYKITL